MARDGEEAIAVIEDHELAVAAEPAGEAHGARRDREHRRAERGVEHDARAEGLRAEVGVDHAPEALRDAAADRRREPSLERREARTADRVRRGRLGAEV